MGKKSTRSHRKKQLKQRQRKRVVLLAGGTLVVVGIIVLVVSSSAAASKADTSYAPADVVNDAPMHGIHEMGPSTVSAVFIPNDQPQPRIGIPQTYQNLGSVPASSEARYTFVIRNEGEAALTISRIYTTCGCTVADLTSSIIPPGKVSLLTVIVDADFHPEAIGTTVRRGVIIESNDRSRRSSEVWVQAFIAPS